MWIMLNDAFFSVVKKDCARDELLVRARRPGDLEKVFPEAKVTRSTKSDYAYRATIKTYVLKAALDVEINRINYSNFKDSVSMDDEPLHNAYMAVWQAMSKVQPTAPYSGFLREALSPEAVDDYHRGKTNSGKKKGGHARAAGMTAFERSEAARHAANVRWGKL